MERRFGGGGRSGGYGDSGPRDMHKCWLRKGMWSAVQTRWKQTSILQRLLPKTQACKVLGKFDYWGNFKISKILKSPNNSEETL